MEKRYVDAVNDRMGSKDFFNQAGVEFLRDAWAAGEFGALRGAGDVRLVADEWPDFELRLNGTLERFELVEADLPGRRRGEEYREAEVRAASGGVGVENDPVEAWIERAERVPEALRAAIKKKIGKHYATRSSLLIYLNIGEFGIRQQEIEASFPPSTELARDEFQAIWILWKKKAYRPWYRALESVG